ncbi:hypothetical protein glysoja_001340 [Glycine soja]|nr:hypothetical protein glysoja_001340 [Glycine soja]
MALVFYICKQTSELAHKGGSHFRLDKKIHIWERF